MLNTKTTYVVYCLYKRKIPVQQTFTDMMEALKHCEKIRNGSMGEDYSHVCMCSENVDQVGKMGVSAVVDGKLPNGEDYTWVMRRDGDIR